MPTYSEIISDVRRQLSALKITDDTRLSSSHVLFVLRSCVARLIYDKARAETNRLFRYNPDPALFKEYELPIDSVTNEATLPVAPLNLPMDQGLGGLYYYDERERCYRLIHVVNTYQAANSQNLWWRNRSATRIGNKLRFLNLHGVKTIRVLLLSTDSPEDSPINIEDQFPIPADLVQPAVEMAVRILAGPMRMTEDVTNDLKDQPGK